MDPTASLESLLIRAGNGSRDDFAAVYDSAASMVYGIAVRVVRDPARAEEISQEAFIDVWRKAPTFDSSRGSAKGWIATIAHRRAVDVVRSEQASRDRTERAAVRETIASHDVVADEVETRDERSRINQALSGLTDLQRQVIELAYYGGNTYKQVAEDLGAPLGTIKTRMRDGLKRLAEILGDADG
ncbi:MAG: ECF RNA polymerase sigma factor SigK [Acidimicrobiia bacterium]|nr:ECF RNA polymerase sigma factor SigK [Acidimicrobiia bacterium]